MAEATRSDPWVIGKEQTPTRGGSDPWVIGKPATITAVPEEPVSYDPAVPYSEDDLERDEYFGIISNYVSDRFGADSVRDKDRKSIVERYLNNMRGFAAGNSVRAVGEIRYLNGLEEGDGKMVRAGEAYQLFENMSGLFSGETSMIEKGEILQDYTRAALLDPVNLLAGWVGKAIGGGTSKVAAAGVRSIAMDAFKKKLAVELAKKGVTKAAAHTAARNAYAGAFVGAASKAGRASVAAKLLRPTGVAALTTREGLKTIAGATAVDAASGIGTDVAYQKALMETGVQDEYSYLQTGVAAAGGVLMGGVAAGRLAARSKLGIPIPDLIINFKTTPAPSKSLAKNMAGQTNKILKLKEGSYAGDWMQRVSAGKALTKGTKSGSLSLKFWKTFINGDKKLGIEGIDDLLINDNWVYKDGMMIGGKEVGYTDWFTTVVETNMIDATGKPKAAFKPLFEEIEKQVGASYTPKRFTKELASIISESGEASSIMSTSRKATSPITLTIPKTKASFDPFADGARRMEIYKAFGDGQDHLIRLLVAHPATTLRNLSGWGVASTINSVDDIIKASLYAGRGWIRNSPADMATARNLAAAQRTKLYSLIDSDMAYEYFASVARMHEKDMMNLKYTSVGGIDATHGIAARMGVPTGSKALREFDKASEAFVNFASAIGGVNAQDSFTKAVEFNYQMDKHLRLAFDIPYTDFYSQPNVNKLMKDKKYIKALTDSISETEKAIFAKSYKNSKTRLGHIAGVIEEARTIPGIGLTVPFGRFFNNSIVFMSDHTGLSLGAKALGIETSRSTGDLVIRGGIGLSIVSALAASDLENIEEGRPLRPITHTELPGGRDIDTASEFPVAPLQAIARVIAYAMSDKELQQEEAEEVAKVLSGQFTRRLSESSASIYEAAIKMIKGESEGSVRNLVDIFSATGLQMSSSLTRFADPYNQAVGLLRGKDSIVPDLRQGGAMGKSMRNLDQIIGALGFELGPQKYSAYEGKVTARPSGVAASKEVMYSDTMKLMDHVSIPYYKINNYTEALAADNRFNHLFFNVFDGKATELLHSDKFLNASQDIKRVYFSEAKKEAREIVYDILLRSPSEADNKFYAQLQVAKDYGWDSIDKAMREIGLEEDFAELDIESLQNLNLWLRDHTEIERSIHEQHYRD